MRQSHKASMFDLDRQVRGRSASTGALPKINTLPTVGRTQLGNVGVLERQILLREEDAGGGRGPPEGRHGSTASTTAPRPAFFGPAFSHPTNGPGGAYRTRRRLCLRPSIKQGKNTGFVMQTTGNYLS